MGEDLEQDRGAAWRVAHTRPRCEKQLAAYCAARRVDHYLPLRRETKIYQRRKVTVQKPLFPGYVFAKVGEEQRVTLLRSRQVVRLLPVPDQERLLVELDQVRRALEADPGLVACQAVREGARVRITTGPFQGLEGVVQAVKGGARVVLNVELINQGVPVETGLDMLERL